MTSPEEDLTTGFFHTFAANQVPDGSQPVLQVLETRRAAAPGSNKQTLRCRLSDGAFSSSYCMGSEEIADRFDADGITGTHATIQVLEYNRRLLSGKYFFHIIDFQLTGFPRTTIGDPRPHNGNPEEFRGIENFSMAMRAETDLTAMSLPQSRKRAGGNMTGGPNKRTGNVTSGGVFDPMIDINLITPFMNSFQICGVVSGKENKREINTKRGPSKVFSFILTDVKGDGIKVTAFGNECEKYADIIRNDKSYYIYCSNSGVVREANKRFNPTSHTYEITLNSKCDVELCTDRDVQPVAIKMQLVKLANIKSHANQCVDVIAIVSKAEEATSITSKAGKPLIKRDLHLVDDSLVQVRLTLWEEQATEFSVELGSVVALKGVSVREFNGGFTLTVSSGTAIYPNLDSDDARALQDWYMNKGSELEFGALENEGGGALERDFRTIRHVEKSGMLQAADDKGVYVYVIVAINNVKSEGTYYQACTNCRKKVIPENGQFRCDRCGISDQSRYLYKLNIEIVDFTGTAWMSMFDDTAHRLLGLDAAQLADLLDRDRSAYDELLNSIKLQRYEMRARARVESYNDQQRIAWTCAQIRPINQDRYGQIHRELDGQVDSTVNFDARKEIFVVTSSIGIS